MMNPIETYDADIPEKEPVESPDIQQRLENAQPVERGADTALSPEGRRAMQQGMQGTDSPGATTPADSPGATTPSDSPGMTTPSDVPEGQIIGTPEQDAQYLHRQTGETCATVAQEGIIEKHTGIDHGEQALAQEAFENGWTDEKGRTYENCIGNLMENHGVPTQRWLDGSADMDTLKNELTQEHDVIVGVDAGEFYQDANRLGDGHAVWVTSLKTGAQGDVSKVTVNDSNFPEPQVHDATIFQDAWNARNRLMVSTC